MQEKNIFFVIPARRDSKGFPFKNRKLLDLTISQIPNELHNKTIVSTNDEEIIHRLESTKINKSDEKDDSINISFSNVNDQIDLNFDLLLLSTGRIPNTDNLELKNTKVKTDNFGFIKVDNKYLTNIDNLSLIHI